MDLKDRVAARRRELEVEAQRAEAVKRQEREAQRKVEDEQRARAKVEHAAEKRALSDAAMDRWSGADIGVLGLLGFLTFIGFFMGGWPGLVMLAILWMYVRNKMEKYRDQVAAESETQGLDKDP